METKNNLSLIEELQNKIIYKDLFDVGDVRNILQEIRESKEEKKLNMQKIF
jgi:hypothetical protein